MVHVMALSPAQIKDQAARSLSPDLTLDVSQVVYGAAVDLQDFDAPEQAIGVKSMVPPVAAIGLAQYLEGDKHDWTARYRNRSGPVGRVADDERQNRSLFAPQQVDHSSDAETVGILIIDLQNQVPLPTTGTFHRAARNHCGNLGILFVGKVV